MSGDAATVLSLAMSLPENERFGIAQKLIESLETEAPANIRDQTLAEEINARRQRVQSGDYVARDWHESIDEIRGSIARDNNA